MDIPSEFRRPETLNRTRVGARHVPAIDRTSAFERQDFAAVEDLHSPQRAFIGNGFLKTNVVYLRRVPGSHLPDTPPPDHQLHKRVHALTSLIVIAGAYDCGIQEVSEEAVDQENALQSSPVSVSVLQGYTDVGWTTKVRVSTSLYQQP